MAKDFGKLVEAIDRVGIQNVSLLTRMTGFAEESVRYNLKKRFPRMGLETRTSLNHTALGLERHFVSMRLAGGAEQSESAILKALSSKAFLTYSCKAPVERRHLAFFSVPVSATHEFRGFLKRLVEEGVLVDYHAERLEWSRHQGLKRRYFDFANGGWSIDWDKVKRQGGTRLPPARDAGPLTPRRIDATDILIIRELELNPWSDIGAVGRKLAVNDRTTRWHYNQHVRGIALSYHVNWATAAPNDLTNAMGFVLEFRGLSSGALAKLRRLLGNFPFSWFEGGRESGYYQVHSSPRFGHTMGSLRFLNASLGEVVDNWKTWTVDPSTAHCYTIPYHNFDRKLGWFFDGDTALEEVLAQSMKSTSRGRYQRFSGKV